MAIATGGTAYATTGYTAHPRSVTFYYGETGGNGDSNNFAGYGAVTLCMNDQGVPSGDTHTYTGTYVHNRTLLPDDYMYSVTWRYSYGEYQSPVSPTPTSDKKYHVLASWQGVPAAANSKKGYVASRTAGYACVWP